jgi:hypothetical protein
VGRFFRLDLAVRSKVALVTDTDVGLITDDGAKLCLICQYPEIECRYSKPRELPEFAKTHGLTTTQQFSSCLTLLFVPRMSPESASGEDESVPENFTLMELID